MANTPQRRFAEFTANWQFERIENIGRVIRGSSPRPKGDSRYYKGPVPRLMVQDVTRDGKWVTPSIDSLTKDGAKLSRPCVAGTLTIVCSGTVGIVSFLAVDACIHDGFLALIDIDEKQVEKDFLYHRLSTLRNQFEKGATHGGVFTNLTTSGVKEFEFRFPTLPEQRKIANFLTAVDQRIGQLIQKKALLEDYKKGVMQQLFSQAIRFKDDEGNDFPDWEEKQLGELGNFTGGGTPDTNDDSYWKGDIPWVSSSDISESTITAINKRRFITETAIKKSATKLVPANSILFISRVGVGKLAICSEQVCTSQDFTNFTPRKDHIKYLGYYFTFNQNLLKRYAQGTSIKGITSQELKKIAVARPSLPEQTKIANFLSALDRKIESVSTQIRETQTFKRGLLQQMFV